MNEHLRDRVLRKLEGLSDERGYQVLDFVEFLESKYAERPASPTSVFTRFTEAVEDRLRAGKVSASAIAETVGLMNRAMNVLNGVATGVAAAGRSVANDIASATAPRPSGAAPPQPTGGAPVAGSGTTAGTAPPPPAVDTASSTPSSDPRATESGELEPPPGG